MDKKISYELLDKTYRDAWYGRDEPNLAMVGTPYGILWLTKKGYYLEDVEISQERALEIWEEVHGGSNHVI